MLPPSMTSRWFKQRRKVLLPEPDGPMTATTSPLRRVSDTPSRTGIPLKDFLMSCASIMILRSSASALIVELGIAFFHALEEPGQHERHEQIKDRRHKER